MKYLHKKEFTRETMEELCDCVSPCFRLELLQDSYDKRIAENQMLQEYIEKGFEMPGGTLKLGIDWVGYNKEDVLLKETGVFFPGKGIIKAVGEGHAYQNAIGPCIGVFSHLYDPKLDTYAMIIRGVKGSVKGTTQEAARQIQIPAGFGEYGILPAETARHEIAEEIYGAKTSEEIKKCLEEKKISLVLPKGIVLDATPFMKGAIPQLLLSYIITGDLSELNQNTIRDIKDLEEFEQISSVQVEAQPFLVKQKNLGDLVKSLQTQNRFFGPVAQTISSFSNWYAQNH